MATSKLYEGVTYSIPATGETNWGGSTGVDGFLIALADNVPQKTGGSFTLSADLDFGGTAHVKGIFKTRTANPAASGVLRLANNEGIGFRNAANSADLVLKANASNLLEFNGSVVQASPGSTTDNAVARFDGTTGLLQNSVFIVSDAGAVTGVTTLVASGAITGTTFNGTVGVGANTGTVGVGIANTSSTDQLQFFTSTTNQGFISSTGSWNIGAVSATAVHRVNTAVQTTVGAAGGASALPATPTGYIEININGTARVIPYYAKS